MSGNDDKVTIYDPSCNNPPTYLNNGTTIVRPWSRTQGVTCFNECITQKNCFSIDQLNMRRKAEVLKYKDNGSKNFTNKQVYSMISKGRHAYKYVPPVHPNIEQNGNTLVVKTKCEKKNYGFASQSNVPGNKNFKIELDNNVPLTHYPYIQRTFKGAQETWPESRYDSTKKGFAVGKSGSAHPRILSNQIIGNLYEGEYWTNTTDITYDYTFSSIIHQHTCLLRGINISIDAVTEPIISGIDSRTIEPSGNIIITQINNRTSKRIINMPGKNQIKFTVTPNCKYSNIGIQLQQPRNNETSNILYFNPFIVSTQQPTHNFALKNIDNFRLSTLGNSIENTYSGTRANDASDDGRVSTLGNYIEEKYWANKNSETDIITDISGIVFYDYNGFDDDISGNLNFAYPNINNKITFSGSKDPKNYSGIKINFNDYAGNRSVNHDNIIIDDFNYSNKIPIIDNIKDIGGSNSAYNNQFYSKTVRNSFTFDSDNSGNDIDFFNFGLEKGRRQAKFDSEECQKQLQFAIQSQQRQIDRIESQIQLLLQLCSKK